MHSLNHSMISHTVQVVLYDMMPWCGKPLDLCSDSLIKAKILNCVASRFPEISQVPRDITLKHKEIVLAG